MLWLGLDELVKNLAGLVELLLAEGRVTLKARALDKGGPFLVEDRFLERIRQGWVFFRAGEVVERDVKVIVLSQGVQKCLSRFVGRGDCWRCEKCQPSNCPK